MKKLIAAIAIVIGWAFPVSAYTLTDHEKQIISIGIGHQARITVLKAVEYDSKSTLVCGIANPKDVSGQYAGDRIFYGALVGKGDEASKFVLFNVGITPEDTELTERLCRERGITF
ncbi:hypothetical protein [Rhizobium sp. LEGMi135b]